MKKTSESEVIVIGAGASGMMAAGRAAEKGARVIVLEKMSEPGKKLMITGKTRCNLTNSREIDDFIPMYGKNGRFLYNAFHVFFRGRLIEFLKRYGVQTKVERGGRVFPASDDAGDVVKALRKYLEDNGVKVLFNQRVVKILTQECRVTGVLTEHGEYKKAGAVILATGGATYPNTGSTGDGYDMAKSAGHKVTRLRPALVPLVVAEIALAKSMQGVSLRNVRLTAFRCRANEIDPLLAPDYDTGRGIKKMKHHKLIIESRFGEFMFTHFGIGGPVTLLISLAVVDALENSPVSVSIDLKPALTREMLDARLQRDFDLLGKRSFKNILKELLPAKLISPFIVLTGISEHKKANQINQYERAIIVNLLKSLRFNIKCPLPMARAIITAGGVDLSEIDPRTMSSRIIRGLFFCGEVIDIDADTGGYNLQAAFSTGFLAGESAAKC